MATYDAGDASINIRPSLKGFVTELEAELKKIDAQLGVAVHPDISRAKEELAAWRAQEERNSIDIPVNVDTNSVQRATREMGKLVDAGKALSALQWNAGALGLGSLPAAATALTAVAGSIQQISQAGLLLPGVMAAGGAAVGTFKLGVAGVADAFKAVEKSADGSTKSIEAANEALADLAPSARDAVKTAAEVKTELTKALQQPVQENLFKGISGDLRKLVDADLPVLQKGLTGIASGLNQNLRQLMATAGSESSQGILDRILGNTGDAQSRLTKAIDPLVHGLGTLAGAGTDTLPRLADGVGRLAQRFDQFTSKADQDGRMAKWIDGGIKGVEHLGSIVLDLGKSLAAITQAAGGGEGLLAILDKGAESLATFLSSAEGQEKLTRFFTEGREQIAQWLDILKNVGPILGDVYSGAKQWTDTLLPPLEVVTGLLSDFPGLIQAGVVAFLAYKTVRPFTGLLSGLSQVNSELSTMQSKAGAVAPGGGAATGSRRSRIRSIAGDLGPTLALAGVSQLATSDSGGGQAFGALTSIAGGAITGGALGGPLGALIGGSAAAGISALTFVLSENARAAKDAADKAAAYAESVRNAADTSRVAAGLQTDLRNALFSSGGAVDSGVTSAVTQRLQNLPTELADVWRATPKQIDGVKDALSKLKIGQDQLAGTITGSQPVFDAMVATLRSQGEAGNIAAQSLISIRDGFLRGQDAAEAAAPLLTDLASKLNTDLPQAASNITNAFNAVPKNVELKADMPGADAVLELLGQINAKVSVDNDKTIHTDIPLAPDVLAQLREITGLVINNNDKTISVGIDQQRYVDSLSKLEVLGDYLRSLPNINVAPPAAPSVPKFPTATLPGADAGASILLPPAAPKRAGGAISGGEPGKDSVHLLGMPGEHMLTTDDVSAMGGQANVYAFRQALHNRGVRGYAGGGAVVDEFGNPINPGVAPGPGAAPSIAPNPYAGGGLAGIFGSVVSGIQGPIGNAMALGSSLANLGGPAAGANGGIIPGLQTQHGAGTIVPPGYAPSGGTAPLSLADRAAGIPGLWGLLGSIGSSDPGKNIMAWGEQTGQWLGNFTARTVGSFATSLWKGALGIVGLENSILSPDNPWNLAGQSVGQFAFGSDGPLGKLLGANPGAGAAGSDSGKQADPKKIREAQQKVADKQKAVEEQRARMAEMPANASQSTRMTRQNALDKAIREANDAQTDLSTLFSGATSGGSGMSGLAYPIGGTGAEQWRPTVRQVLAAYGPAYGITGSNFQSWEDALVRQINTESGGNPNSVNTNDSNGRGGTQRVAGILNFLQSTFEAHNVTGGDYMDPGSQIAAALPYVAKRWGVDENGAPLQIGRGQGFAFGGGVRGPGGPKGDQIPAMLSDNEHVLTAEDVDAMGGQSAVYAFRGALHRAPGGEVSLALLRNPPPPPRPTVPDIKPMTPRPPAPTPAPRPAPAPAAQQPAPAPAPQGPQPATQEPAQQQGGQSRIGGPGPGSAPSQLNHNLPWIDTAIDSTASTLGNIAATAMSMGAAGGTAGMGGGAGGALASSMVAGLFQQGGKIAKNVVNVFSSALVGNLGDNTTAGAYGAPLLSAPPQPARSIDARTVFGDVSANDPRDFVEKQRLYEQQRSQTMVDYV